MKDFSELDLKNLIVDAPIGKKKIDLEGSPVSESEWKSQKPMPGFQYYYKKLSTKRSKCLEK